MPQLRPGAAKLINKKKKKKKGEQEEVNANKRGVSGLSFGGTPTFIN